MSGTAAVVAMVAVGAIRLVQALAGEKPSRGMLESDRVLRGQYRVRTWPIAKLPDGEQGRLVGTARELHHPLTAPLSGRACLYYVVLVKPGARSGARELVTERRGVMFAFEDASGRATIDPAHASVALAFDHREEVRSPDALSPAQRALLLRHDHRIDGAIQLRFVEAVLSIGERITVVGAGLRRPDFTAPVEMDYRSAPPSRLHLSASDAAPLLISSQLVR
jgi:hypothetical protein